jgi:hypothetical protein
MHVVHIGVQIVLPALAMLLLAAWLVLPALRGFVPPSPIIPRRALALGVSAETVDRPFSVGLLASTPSRGPPGQRQRSIVPDLWGEISQP